MFEKFVGVIRNYKGAIIKGAVVGLAVWGVTAVAKALTGTDEEPEYEGEFDESEIPFETEQDGSEQ